MLDGDWWSNLHPETCPSEERTPMRCPLTRRLGGPESWSGRSGDKKNLLPLPGIEFQSAQSLILANFLHLHITVNSKLQTIHSAHTQDVRFSEWGFTQACDTMEFSTNSPTSWRNLLS